MRFSTRLMLSFALTAVMTAAILVAVLGFVWEGQFRGYTRQNMQRASFFAGRAFTRGCVGYVHGIGHRLGGLYGVPHGLAMATILTHVFSDDLLFPYSFEKLAELADAVGIEGDSKKDKAKKFVKAIRDMEDRMEIPYGFKEIQTEDIPIIAQRCMAEVNPTYPVPHIFSQEDLEWFIKNHLQITE